MRRIDSIFHPCVEALCVGNFEMYGRIIYTLEKMVSFRIVIDYKNKNTAVYRNGDKNKW
jgi:hypothetical protein